MKKKNHKYHDGGSFEQHLRSFNPRSPQVDLAELKRHVANVDHPQTGPSEDRSAVFASKIWCTLAASWLCGAAIGAGVMFFLMEKSEQRLVSRVRQIQIPTVTPTATVIPDPTGILIQHNLTEDRPKAAISQDRKLAEHAMEDQEFQHATVPLSFAPDLIGFANRAQVLRPGTNFGAEELSQNSYLDTRERSSVPKNAPTDTDSYETVSKIMRDIQLPSGSVSTRESLLKDLLEIH